MTHIYVSKVIDAPIEDVWAIARDFTGHWHSSVICNSSITLYSGASSITWNSGLPRLPARVISAKP